MTGNTHIIGLGVNDLSDILPQLHDVRWYLHFEVGGMISKIAY